MQLVEQRVDYEFAAVGERGGQGCSDNLDVLVGGDLVGEGVAVFFHCCSSCC